MGKLQVGINHIEFWVSNIEKSLSFYGPLFEIIGWHPVGARAFSSGAVEVYFVQKSVPRPDSLGPRHICFQATSREMVEQVAAFLRQVDAAVIRGPVDVPKYSEGYYTVDFRDPDGFVLEVAYTPNMVL